MVPRRLSACGSSLSSKLSGATVQIAARSTFHHNHVRQSVPCAFSTFKASTQSAPNRNSHGVNLNMSSTRIWAARPLNGISRSHFARPGLAQTHLIRCLNPTPAAGRHPEALVILRVHQVRYQSTGGKKFTEGQPQGQPPTSSSSALLRALRQSLSLAPLVGAFRGQSLQRLYRQSPEELVIALALYVE